MKKIPVIVEKVVDGDTVYVTDPSTGNFMKLRINGIDAPEMKQAGGPESKSAMEELLQLGEAVYLEKMGGRGRYGRVIAKLYIKDEDNDSLRDVQLEMIRSGNAWWYSQYDDTPEYREAMELARREKIGLWSQEDGDPIEPSQYRRMRRMKSAIRKERVDPVKVVSYDLTRDITEPAQKKYIRSSIASFLGNDCTVDKMCYLYRKFSCCIEK